MASSTGMSSRPGQPPWGRADRGDGHRGAGNRHRGFLVCAPVGAIVALALANSAQQRIEASGGRLSGMEQARAARIIAIIELVLTAIVVLVLAVGAVIAVNTSGGRRRGCLSRRPCRRHGR